MAPEEDFTVLIKGAGELFLPLWKGAQFIPMGEYHSILNGDQPAVLLPYLGEAFPVAGYLPQELRAEHIVMAGMSIQQKVWELPYSIGNEVYLQLKSSSATLWSDGEVDKFKDFYFFHGGALGVMVATHLGELEMNIQVNRDLRWSYYLGLSTSSVLFEQRYY